MTFSDFNLRQDLLDGIQSIGFKTPTPIQEQAIPKILEGKDLLASAQTGTGKTAAFLLPIVNDLIDAEHNNKVKALVIVPTRELAQQIDQQMEGLSYFTSVSSIAIYGGSGGDVFTTEKKALSQGVDIAICTPGRMIAHLAMGYVNLDELKYLVLDEADRMLDMGFYNDIMKIISYMPKNRQTLLFSATFPKKIQELAKKILKDEYDQIKLSISKPAENIEQVAFIVHEEQKLPILAHMLKAKPLQSIIVFCSTKINADKVSYKFLKEGFSVQAIHSDLDQSQRIEALRQFKNRKLNILVATDILARGIDVEDIDLVVNYDVPKEGEDYIHRIGRTARAAAAGMAFIFVNEQDQKRFHKIEKLLGYPIKKANIPAKFGDTPTYDPEVFERKRAKKDKRSRR
ncbi:MAG: DEAD/DEAH box helicase [Candidatus Cyclobacteriaceae bacterium M2_1C_046]